MDLTDNIHSETNTGKKKVHRQLTKKENTMLIALRHHYYIPYIINAR